jgi:hypothetical protein
MSTTEAALRSCEIGQIGHILVRRSAPASSKWTANAWRRGTKKSPSRILFASSSTEYAVLFT